MTLLRHRSRSSYQRRWYLVGTLTLLGTLLAACGGTSTKGSSAPASGSTGPTTTISVAYYPGALTSLPAFIAAGKGFFTANHLKVNLVPIPNGGAMTSALASGSVAFVNNSYDNLMEAVTKGLPLRAVVGNTVAAPFALVARKGIPIPNLSAGYPKDLAGLLHTTWGVIQLGVSTQFIDEELLGGAGYSPNSVTYVAVGLPTTALPALLRGSVDTYLSFAPMTSIVLDKNEATMVVNFMAGQGPADFRNVNYNGWWATTSYISQNPTVVKEFIAANEQAYCWYQNPANLNAATAIINNYVKVPQLTSKQYTQMVASNLPAYGVDINAQSIAAWNHLLDTYHILTKPLSRSEIVSSLAPSNYKCP